VRPGDLFRNYSLTLSTFHNWSHEALDDVWSFDSWKKARTRGSYSLNTNAQFLNYWNVRVNASYSPQAMSRSATRGGPVMVDPASTRMSLNVSSDRRKSFSFSSNVELRNDRRGRGGSWSIIGDIRVQPSDNLQLLLNPSWSTSRSGDQFVTTTSTLSYDPTFGTRYLFADLERRSFAMETRLDWTFSPTLSLQLFAHPLLSSGDYLRYEQLAAPGSYDFVGFTPGSRQVGADGSVIGNAVIRWEYRPGSTVFFVWQRRQADRALVCDFDFGRDAGALFGAPADNRFIVKVNWWLGM